MANEEHVAILKQGADAWNNWSYERWKIFWGSDIEVNFGIADFSGADFSGFDLRDLDIGSTDFSSANLSGANLSGANFEATNFRKANLERVNLSKAELMGATLVDADLRDADLESTGLVMVNLSRASLNGANLSKAYLQKANLSEADLAGTNLNGTEYDDDTVWPKDFVPPVEAIKVDYWTSSPVDTPVATDDFEDTLILSYSRSKVLLMTIGSLVFTLGSFGLIVQGSNDTDTILLLIGFLGASLFGIGTINGTKKLFTKSKNVILTLPKKGIGRV